MGWRQRTSRCPRDNGSEQDNGKTLPTLQDLVLHDAGVEAPEPVKLQRITWKGFGMVALTPSASTSCSRRSSA